MYLKRETGFGSKPHMNDVYVEVFNIQFFNEDGFESSILEKKIYCQIDLKNQHTSVKGKKLKNMEAKRMRNGYNIDTLTSVETREIVKIGGKVIKIYEGVIYRENLRK